MLAVLAILLPASVLGLFYLHAFRSEDVKTFRPRLSVLRFQPGDLDHDCTAEINRRRFLTDLRAAAWLLRWAFAAVALAASLLTLTIARLLS